MEEQEKRKKKHKINLSFINAWQLSEESELENLDSILP